MKKLLIVTRNMAGDGAERVLKYLIDKLSEKAIEVHLVLLEKKNIFYDLPATCQIYEIEAKYKKHLLQKKYAYSSVKKICKTVKPDLVFSMPEEIGIFVSLALYNIKTPIIVSERNDPWKMPNKKITRILRHFAYHRVNGIIFQTKQAQSFFGKKIIKKSIVLKNPINLTQFSTLKETKKKKIIVSTGRLEPQKNHKLLIDAFNIFAKTHSDYCLIIYGEGNLRQDLEKQITLLKLEKRVFLPGKKKNIVEIIQDCTIFAFSSDYEGVPNSVIEAMAVGLPIIATNCSPGGVESLITNNYNGIIVPVGDVDSFAFQLGRLADDETLRNELSLKAKETIKMFDSKIVLEEWINYFENVIKKSK